MLTKGPVCQTFWQLSLKFKHIFYQTFNQNFIQTSDHSKEVQVPLELRTKARQRQSASEALTTFWWAQAKDKDKTPNYCRLMKLNLFSYPNSNLEEQWYSLYRYRYWCYTIQSIQKFNSLQKWKYFEILFCMFCMTKYKYQKIQLILFYSGLKVKILKALSPNSVSEMWMKISFTYEWFFYEIKEHWDQSMYRHHSNVWNQCFCSNPWSLWLRVRLFISNTSSQLARVNIQHAQVWVASPSIIWLDKLMMKMWSAIWGGEGAQLMDFGSHTHSLLVASHWLLTIQWCLYGILKW